MNKTVEDMVLTICITILVTVTLITMAITSSKDEKIKLLEQSLNEQIEEKQVYMNMFEEERGK